MATQDSYAPRYRWILYLWPALLLIGLTALLAWRFWPKSEDRQATLNTVPGLNTVKETELILRRLEKPLVEFSNWTVVVPVGLALMVMLLIVLFKREHRLKTLGWSSLFLAVLGGAYVGFALFFKAMFTWWVILVPCLGVALFYVGMMYFKDCQTIHPSWASFLGFLRCAVYALLAAIFLLPANLTYEATFKGSKAILLFDVSESMIKGIDDFPDEDQDPKTLPSRQDKIIAWLTTPGANGTVIEQMLRRSPLSIYRFGGTLDDRNVLHVKNVADWHTKNWGKVEWTRFLKPEKPAVPEILKKEDKDLTEDEKKKRDDDQKRWQADMGLVEDLRQGTNIGRALQQVADLEAGEFVQAIVLLSDGQSNQGTEDDARQFQLKLQKAKSTVHLFTVGVGTFLPPVSLRVDDLQGPKVARPDDKFPVRVPVLGTGLADRTFKVFIDMERVGKGEKLQFGPFDRKFKAGGDTQEDTTEQEIDLKELFKEELDKAKADLRAKHDDWPRDKIEQEALNVLEGKYEFTARVPRIKGESFQEAEHKSKPFVVQVQRAKPRILLFAGGPSREYQFLRTLLFREVTADRMELSVFLQTVQEGTDQDVKGEKLLTKFPETLEKSAKDDSLANFDLIIAIDPDWSALSYEQLKMMQTWVDAHAGGIIFIAGPVHSYHLARPGGVDITPLLTIYPVTLKDSRLHGLGIDHDPRRPYPLQFTETAKQQDFLNIEETAENPLYAWDKFFWPDGVRPPDKDAVPVRGMFNFYPVDKLKSDSTVLASFIGGEKSRINDGKDPQPYLVLMRYGQGKTIYIGSPETWRLRSYKENLHERFWIKLSRFMAASTAMKTNYGYISLSNEYTTGAIPFEAQLKGENGLPLPRESQVVVKVTRPEDFDPRVDPTTPAQFTLQPKPGQGEWKGWFTGMFKVGTPGKYVFEIAIPGGPAGASVSHEIMVRQANLEMDNLRTDFPALYRLATSARPISRRVASKEFDKIVQTPPEGVDPRDAPKEGRLFLRLKHADYLPDALIQEDPHIVGEKGDTKDIWDSWNWKSGLQLSLFEILVWIFDVVGFLVIGILLMTRRMWWSVLVLVGAWVVSHTLLGAGFYLAAQEDPSTGLITALRVTAIILGAAGFIALVAMLLTAREWVTFGNVIGFAIVVGALFLVHRMANPWQPLFNGNDLTDWKVQPKGLKGVWTVEDRTIRGTGTQGQLVSERSDFKNFQLRAEMKTNNPEAVVLGYRLPRTGSGQAVKLSAAPVDTWFTYELIASGDTVQVKINGKEVDQIEDKKPVAGSFLLQTTHPQASVQVRSIEVREPIMLPVDISWVLMIAVGLLSIEWLTRKLLKLA